MNPALHFGSDLWIMSLNKLVAARPVSKKETFIRMSQRHFHKKIFYITPSIVIYIIVPTIN